MNSTSSTLREASGEIGLYPVFKDERGNGGFFALLESAIGLRVLPFTCGRSAMVAGLSALGLGRMDEILIPPFLGQCVLSALYRTSFPTMTLSNRTKAILVYHQFGFPQDISDIESTAQEKGWFILNDCANTIFSQVNGKLLMEWGDFAIISLSKLYPCALGGGFYSRRADISKKVYAEHEIRSGIDAEKAEDAVEKLIKINNGCFGDETVFEIMGLYGYLPDLVSFPQKSYSALPSSKEDIEKERAHRKNIWSIIKNMFPDRVPACDENEMVIPFAVPVSGDACDLEKISKEIKEDLSLDAPVLHFDYARNMLKPDYRKSIVVGCHQDWSEELVVKICETIKRGAR